MATEALPQLGTEPPAALPHRRRWIAAVVVLALVVAATLAWKAWSDHRADIRSGTTLVSTEELAAHYGIDVNLIAVTAAGGLIEFRYQVVDPDKAARLLHDAKLAPAFVVEKTGETLVMSSPPHSHGAELRLGGTYYFLMANAHDAVHRGTKLTLVVGDLRVEHLTVEG